MKFRMCRGDNKSRRASGWQDERASPGLADMQLRGGSKMMFPLGTSLSCAKWQGERHWRTYALRERSRAERKKNDHS